MPRALAPLAAVVVLVTASCGTSVKMAPTYGPPDTAAPPTSVTAPSATASAPPVPTDNTAELFDCLGPDACPTSMEDRAKRRAAAAFGCSADQIVAKARPTKGLSVVGSTMVFAARGTAQIAVQGAKPGDAFYVNGCGQSAILACVHANRSVHTPDQTYENTDDRVCLWATE